MSGSLHELLFEALLALRNPDECSAFLADLLTPQECDAVAQRIAVARALQEGATYEQAAAQTGASSATISRVRRALFLGSGGYEMVLRRISGIE
ncbi:MAG: YerC/YecD family TrpR-related protein [Thermaerobacter sp.]|nr:YerC/YecD family TrpR-related protein [Thermaerobacter sp.]